MVNERYNKFWLRTHQKPEYFKAQPNAGHYAIAAISQMCNAKVVYVQPQYLPPAPALYGVLPTCTHGGAARHCHSATETGA